jgi:predicted transcriptional regulator
MTKKKELEILKRGVEVWNEWREENPDIIPDLSGSDLSGMKLKKVNFYLSNLSGSIFKNADLIGADLSEATLLKTDLQ